MSFLGMGRQQPTSEQKIAAVEGEMRMMADTYNRYSPAGVPEEVRPDRLPRGRAQQGRVRLPRPLHRKVPRHEHEGQRDHAAAGAGYGRRGAAAGRWWPLLSYARAVPCLSCPPRGRSAAREGASS
ncbi:hypothetical protein VFPBJ_08615 [Purpureocillium lilacinum]|uniref:Uncharacterized protein n=1 Tax=Purpureocillium lilacinum TaxID=33203 RepID=A0A179GEJ4_PURLI|nr:hypothetical protein VFPBJ_08615 [Purpureocillium lilacinum]